MCSTVNHTDHVPRILVAEDDPLARDLLRITLELHSFHVDTVPTGRIALQRWEEGTYDLILMDIQMPQMDGITATREIRRKERERGGHTPIVAVTAHSISEDEQKCLAAGMDGYMMKPLDLEKGLEMIRGLIRR